MTKNEVGLAQFLRQLNTKHHNNLANGVYKSFVMSDLDSRLDEQMRQNIQALLKGVN